MRLQLVTYAAEEQSFFPPLPLLSQTLAMQSSLTPSAMLVPTRCFCEPIQLSIIVEKLSSELSDFLNAILES